MLSCGVSNLIRRHFKTGWPSRSLHSPTPTLLVEDESYLIGRCAIAKNFYQQMSKAPLFILEESLEERVKRIKPAQRVFQKTRIFYSSTSRLDLEKRS